VTIVWACGLSVEAYAAAGRAVVVPRPGCPACGAPMMFWSGYERSVRQGQVWRIWVRRARCCRTHALLPSFCLQGRLDSVEVIGPAVAAAVAGLGTRSVARRGGVVPHSTARGWCRRHRQRARVGLAVMTVMVTALGTALDGPVVSAEAVALSALETVAGAVCGSEGLGLWPAVSVSTGGLWLASTGPPTPTGLYAAAGGDGLMASMPSPSPGRPP
jgi:hypothetical protein